jgi:hypothetical protein
VTPFPARVDFVNNAVELMAQRLRIAPIIIRVAFVAAVASVVMHVAFLRPMQMGWGATDVEMARPLPGDKVVGNATFVATRALTVEAPPEQVWPWIVKMGVEDRRFVKGFEANRYMLWLTRTAPRLTWCWTLTPIGLERTRVVTRVRFYHSWTSPAAFRVLLADLGDFYRVRRALLDVKSQAEAATAAARAAQ